MNLFHEVTAHMRRMDKVFIAAINGSWPWAAVASRARAAATCA